MRAGGAASLVAIIAMGVVLFRYAADPPEPLQPAGVPSPVAELALSEPEVRHPLATDSAGNELPPLDDSDALMRQALADLWGPGLVEQLFNLNGFVRRIVATIDNLPRRDASFRLAPVRFVASSRAGVSGSRAR